LIGKAQLLPHLRRRRRQPGLFINVYRQVRTQPVRKADYWIQPCDSSLGTAVYFRRPVPWSGRLRIAECRLAITFSRPLRGLAAVLITPPPSNKLPGYSHSVRFADWIWINCREPIHE